MPWQKPLVREQRNALVQALLARREPAKIICARFGISRQTAYKFLRRFLAQGARGLDDLSRRPHAESQQTRDWRRRLLRLRHSHRGWGARKLRWLLRQRYGGAVPGERTLQRWLATAGLTRTPRRRANASHTGMRRWRGARIISGPSI